MEDKGEKQEYVFYKEKELLNGYTNVARLKFLSEILQQKCITDSAAKSLSQIVQQVYHK